MLTIHETPIGTIVTGPGDELMAALLTPEAARRALLTARKCLAVAQADLASFDAETARGYDGPVITLLDRMCLGCWEHAHRPAARDLIVERVARCFRAVRAAEAVWERMGRAVTLAAG